VTGVVIVTRMFPRSWGNVDGGQRMHCVSLSLR